MTMTSLNLHLPLMIASLLIMFGCSDSRDTAPATPYQSAMSSPCAGGVCLGMTCVNPDGNTHDACGCGTDYCVPNERTVEFAGLTPLTCTKRDCVLDQPETCPQGYVCLEIPDFALTWLDEEKGIQMPQYLCVPDEEPAPMSNAPSTQDEVWITLSGGSFQMGHPEQVTHTVTLLPFEILKTEVTNGQYRHCVAQGQCTPAGTGMGCTGALSETDLPINCVSWDQGRAFCQSMGGDLPSESQWEFAARSQGQTLWPWGDVPPTCERVVMQESGRDACGAEGAQPVCSRTSGSSQQGICDMIGNVWEWTMDDYQADLDQIPADGSALIISESTPKVSRGGAYAYDEDYQSAFYRNDHGQASFQVPTYGFRCVR